MLDGFGDLWLNGERVWANPRIGYRGDSVYNTFMHFLECLERKWPFETTVEDHLHTDAAMEACYLSLAQKRPVAPAHLLKPAG